MLRWTVLLLIAALAWPMGEAAAVVCDPSAMEAMPCCEQSMGDCGMPGMTGDALIVEARALADRSAFYDNIRAKIPFRVVATIERGRLGGEADWPAWTPTVLTRA